MASVVDTSVKYFTSAMIGAPVLRGQTGSLIAILDACLINGFGLQTASYVDITSGICTMTFPTEHVALVDCVVFVSGSPVDALNGEQKITATAPYTLQFATDAPDGNPTGTITVKLAGAGWAKPFSGTNLAVYKSQHIATNGHFLRINDTNASIARVVGYENMTAISTGTGLFPTTTQLNGGLYWTKSSAANSIVIDWTLVADGRIFYLLPSSYMGNDVPDAKNAPLYSFGDPSNISLSPDTWSTVILGDSTPLANQAAKYFFNDGYNDKRYSPRNARGTGTSTQITIHTTAPSVSVDAGYDKLSGQIRYFPIVVRVAATPDLGGDSWRSYVTGILLSEHIGSELYMPHLAIFKAGVPEKSYLNFNTGYGLSEIVNLQSMIFDVTGPWR